MRPFLCWCAARRPMPTLLSPFLLAVVAGTAGAQPTFIRGDINMDGQVSLVDLSYFFDARFLAGPPPRCVDAVDTDDNGQIDFSGLSDATFLRDWLFRTGSPATLPPPFPLPGVDPTTDALGCADPMVTPPGGPAAGFAMAWENATVMRRGSKDQEFFLLATTASPIECISIAYRIDRSFLENVRADLQDTIFPQDLRQEFEASPVFGVHVVPSADPAFDLLLAGAVFVTQSTQGGPGGQLDGRGGGGGAPVHRIGFPATTGVLTGARLLRVRGDVRADAPKGVVIAILSPALKEDFTAAGGDAFHGVRNEFGGLFEAMGGSPPAFIPEDALPGHGAGIDGDDFLRGDSNGDGRVDISDPKFTLGFLFNGTPAPICRDAADANDSGHVDISDPVFTLGFLFYGTAAPPEPGPFFCGLDRILVVDDDLGDCFTPNPCKDNPPP